MRLSVWTRTLIALWSIWFATALTEPVGVLACREHSAAVTDPAAHHPASHAAEMPGNAMESHGATGHDAIGHAVVVRDTESSIPAEHSCCTCLGQCCTMSPAASPRGVDTIVATLLHATRTASIAETQRAPTRNAHVLPFANGPPPIAL